MVHGRVLGATGSLPADVHNEVGYKHPIVSTDSQVADDVLRSIRQIIRRVSEHSKSLARDVGLTLPQLICLRAIGDARAQGTPSDDITVMMVSKAVQLSPATVSRIIDRLEKAGLITRSRTNKDRRRVVLELTDSGSKRYQTLPVPLQERFIQRLMQLDEDERLALLDALRRVTRMMDAADIDAAPLLTPETTIRD